MKIWLTLSLSVVVVLSTTRGVLAQQDESSTKKSSTGHYVENSILTEGAKSAKPQSLTIFSNGLVYDVSVGGTRVVIFNPAQGKLVLLDKRRKVKTEIHTADLKAAREELRAWCLKQADSVLRFCAKPKFEIIRSDHRLEFRAREIDRKSVV